MQKGGRIKFDGSKWIVDSKYTHLASEKEAEALNLLGFKAITDITKMDSVMYKDIARSNKNYNSTILKLYHDLTPEKQKKIIQCFQEAFEKRIEENNKFTQKTKISNNIGHLSYPELIENVLKQLKFGPDTLTSPLPSVRLQSAPPLRQLNKLNINTRKISRKLTYPNKEITYLDKENAGNKFKKTKRRKKEKKKREQRKRENKEKERTKKKREQRKRENK